jgi:NADH-ubiquinone oxidoreductase chain 5
MAAPTPISALVHSSTLVTSGLFLIMRYSFIIYSSYLLVKILLILSIYTSFYAGINTIFEKDLKKLIALSTLSHLGFIGMAFSAGLLYFAFFHILTHALFKSLLFMTIGDIMINLNHSQDIRYLSKGMSYTPFSCFIIYVSLLNLLGIPSLSGFFSKDLVLEIINYSYSSYLSSFLVYFNVFFTYYYTYQLFFYSFQSNKVFPYQNFHSPILFHSILLFFIALSSLLFGYFFIRFIYPYILFYPVPSLIKFYPITLNVLIFVGLFIFTYLFSSRNQFLNYYFSNIMFLSTFIISLTSYSFLSLSSSLTKTFELGAFNSLINIYPSSFFSHLRKKILKSSLFNPLQFVFLASIALLVFIALLNSIIYYV